jgi:hypothetical protein
MSPSQLLCVLMNSHERETHCPSRGVRKGIKRSDASTLCWFYKIQNLKNAWVWKTPIWTKDWTSPYFLMKETGRLVHDRKCDVNPTTMHHKMYILSTLKKKTHCYPPRVHPFLPQTTKPWQACLVHNYQVQRCVKRKALEMEPGRIPVVHHVPKAHSAWTETLRNDRPSQGQKSSSGIPTSLLALRWEKRVWCNKGGMSLLQMCESHRRLVTLSLLDASITFEKNHFLSCELCVVWIMPGK